MYLLPDRQLHLCNYTTFGICHESLNSAIHILMGDNKRFCFWPAPKVLCSLIRITRSQLYFRQYKLIFYTISHLSTLSGKCPLSVIFFDAQLLHSRKINSCFPSFKFFIHFSLCNKKLVDRWQIQLEKATRKTLKYSMNFIGYVTILWSLSNFLWTIVNCSALLWEDRSSSLYWIPSFLFVRSSILSTSDML